MTDDRRALAERLAQRVFDKYRQGQEERYDALAEQPSHDRERAILCVLAGLSHRDPHAEREAAKQAWDAARLEERCPADAVTEAMRDLLASAIGQAVVSCAHFASRNIPTEAWNVDYAGIIARALAALGLTPEGK